MEDENITIKALESVLDVYVEENKELQDENDSLVALLCRIQDIADGDIAFRSTLDEWGIKLW